MCIRDRHCRAHSQHQVPDAGKAQQAAERLQRQHITQKNKTRAVRDRCVGKDLAGGELRGQTGACGRLQHARGYRHCAAVQRDNGKIHSGAGAEHKTPNAAAQVCRHKNKQQAIMQQTYGQGRIRRKRGEQMRCIRPRSLAQIGGHRKPQQRDIVLCYCSCLLYTSFWRKYSG